MDEGLMHPWQGTVGDQEPRSSGLSSLLRLCKIEVRPMASPPIPLQPFFLFFIFLKPESEPLEKAGPDGPLPCPQWPRAQPSLELSELRFPGFWKLSSGIVGKVRWVNVWKSLTICPAQGRLIGAYKFDVPRCHEHRHCLHPALPLSS